MSGATGAALGAIAFSVQGYFLSIRTSSITRIYLLCHQLLHALYRNELVTRTYSCKDLRGERYSAPQASTTPQVLDWIRQTEFGGVVESLRLKRHFLGQSRRYLYGRYQRLLANQ